MITGSGLDYIDIIVGEGAQAKPGRTIRVHYTGTLTSGKVFDSSITRGETIEFVLGKGDVIKGWDEGIALMKVGGKANLPSHRTWHTETAEREAQSFPKCHPGI
jgi:peptidylprolyl isomerase